MTCGLKRYIRIVFKTPSYTPGGLCHGKNLAVASPVTQAADTFTRPVP